MKKSLLILLSALTVACAGAGVAFSAPYTRTANAETVATMDLDFAEVADANAFTAFGGSAGWKVTDGKYAPNAAWASVNTVKQLDLTSDQQISFDVYLSSAEASDPNRQFNFGFFADLANVGVGSGLNFSVCHSLWATTDFGKQGWSAECVKDYYNDQTHSVKITVKSGVVSLAIDGEEISFFGNNAVLYTAQKPADKAYFLMQATGTTTYVDNFKVESLMLGNESYDFASATDGGNFTAFGGSAGWKVTDGKYAPNAAWASVNTVKRLDLTKNQEISFDVYLSSSEASDPNRQFNFGFFADLATAPNAGSGLNFSFGSTVWVSTNFGRAGWASEYVKDYYDNQVHTVKMSIVDKKIALTVDGEEIAFLTNGAAYTPTFTANAVYLLMQSTSTATYVDNFKIESLNVEELSLDFAEATDANGMTALALDGWKVSGGKYVPSQAGALHNASAFRLTKALSMTGTKYISFDFYAADKTFDVGFLDTAAENMWGKALFIHAPYADEDGNIGVNTYVDCTSGEYLGGATINCADGKAHNMKIVIADGKVSYVLDGQAIEFNQGTSAFNVPSETAYLVFRAVGADSYIDNLVISNSDIEYVPPAVEPDEPVDPPVVDPEDPAVIGTLDLDFSETADGDAFLVNDLEGWTVTDGKYVPAKAWASVKSAGVLDLTKDQQITFDVYLSSTDADKQFNFGFFADVATAPNVGSGINYSLGSTFWVGSQFGRQGWIADVAANLYTDTVWSVKITVESGQMRIALNGTEYDVLTVNVPADKAYMMMQATSTATYIDNFKIGAIADDEPVTPPPPPAVETLDELSLDFSEATHGDETTDLALDGWTIVDGKYAPSQAGVMYGASAFRLTKALSMTGTKYISFDFYAAAPTFDIGFLDTAAENMWGNALFIHTPYADGNIGVNTYVDCTSGQYLGGSSIQCVDGKMHNMKIVIADGKVSYVLDGQAIEFNQGTSAFDVPSETAYLVFRAVGTDSYIDNLVISNSDIEYVPPVVDNTYTEAEIAFNAGEDTKYFATLGNEGWAAENGAFYPKWLAWASTYLKQPVPMNETKYISFDFYAVPDNGDLAASQFNFMFLTDLESFEASAAIHCFVNGTTPVLTVNQSMGRDLWIGDVDFDWTDDKYHNMMIAIEDGVVSFFIDGEQLTSKNNLPVVVELSKDQMEATTYFAMQATNVMSRIDNFKISSSKIEYVAPVPETPAEFEEIAVDFSDSENTGFVKTQSSMGEWVVNADGGLSASTAWAVAYLDKQIPVIEEKTLTFNFKLAADESGHQFNVALSMSQESYYGFVMMFMNGTLQIGYTMTPSVRVIENVTNKWFDGEEHTMKIVLENGEAAVVIDGEVIVRGIRLGMTNAYLKLQSTNTTDSIDNLTIISHAEPLTTPDSDGDIAHRPSENPENGATDPTGKNKSNGVWIALLVVFSVLTVGAAAAVLLVFLKKKKKE